MTQPLISLKHWVGQATLEATPGTAEAAPTLYIPLKTGDVNTKVGMITPEETRGVLSTEWVSVPTINEYAGTFTSVYYTDMTYAWLYNILGSQIHTTLEAGVEQYVAKLSSTNRPTMTLFENRWQEADHLDAYSGTVIDKFTGKFVPASSLFDISVSTKSLHHTVVAGALPTTVFTSEVPFAAAGVQATKASSAFVDLTDFEIDIAVNHASYKGADGTPEYTYIVPGKFQVNCKGTFFASRSEFEKYLAGTEEAFEFTFTGAAIGTTHHKSVKFTIPRTKYNNYDVKYDKSLQMATVAAKVLYDQTSGSPLTVTNITDRVATAW